MKVKTHLPILVQPIVDALVEPLERARPTTPMTLIDGTFGGGGHTRALLRRLEVAGLTTHRILALDRDRDAVERGRAEFATEIESGRLKIVHAPFSQWLDVARGEIVIGLLADLGFSSIQMDDPERGLSFRSDGPLDMRLDRSQGQTAYQFLLETRESDLVEIIREYGEERFASRIARAIADARDREALPNTPAALAQLIVKALPPPARHQRIHAATRTFQALRIAVNGELEELDKLLENSSEGIVLGGRVAILSFHSLEDRRVKRFFREHEQWEPLFKKPLIPDAKEQAENPRSRSAKLRVAERR